ncbi:BAX inhibitor (BI)-1/YccA family protein [Campylobacter sp. MIT 99-7217]|uniref:Bax inhibitor-1/YccA family protein n=1 Tax=Campylobacter sp. MIT 99-7217 TaxID=535091 RepID=UPI0011590D29|nr:Bax inhibitor-1/YccA family protein [Campylobacter sp. MIT 99-7217]TQR30985.1 BAX inhibitor (BI)-1/YccA family protein [Campylobacter sp. MIT 99-7217]
MSLYDRDYTRSGEFEAQGQSSALSTFIKQTYQLFAASLLAGAAGAYVGVTALIPLFASGGMITSLIFFAVAIVLLFALQAAKRKTPLNLVLLFAFTFVLGASLAPLLYSVLRLASGGVIVAQAFALTSVAFGALSVFAINTKRDFTTMGKMLFIALIVLIVASLIGFFFQSPMYQLVISSIAAILFSFFILYDTQNIIRGNYETPIEGAVALYLDFINLFSSLLSILGIANRE